MMFQTPADLTDSASWAIEVPGTYTTLTMQADRNMEN